MWTERIVRTAAALAIAAAALVPVAASAAVPNDTPQTALVLSGTVEGDLDAAPPNLGSGRQAFYQFQYPGDGSTVTVDVDFAPGDPATAPHAGFHVYGPTNGKLYATGGQTGTHPSYEAQFTSTEPGTYLLEVFNYNVTRVRYAASATGLPPQAAQPTPTPKPPLTAADVGAPAPSPATARAAPTAPAAPVGQNTSADRAADWTGPVSATLAGSTAGRFHFYRFSYPGDGSSVRIDLDVNPPDQQTAQTAGFVVYGPTAGREYTRGAYQGKPPTHSTVLVTNEPGTYLVQVFNYGATPIQYGLDIAGLPAAPAPAPSAPAPGAPPAAASAADAASPTPTAAAVSAPTVGLNTTPAGAVTLTDPISAVLFASGPSSIHYYRFAYPGDGSRARVDVDVTPSSAGSAVELVVYARNGGAEVARGVYQVGATPTHSATFSGGPAGDYLVQVVNHGSAPVAYRLSLARG